jgi:hypothetical protein
MLVRKEKPMKHFLIILTLCFAFVPCALAQQPTANAPATKEDVEKYLHAVHMHQKLLQVAEAMAKPMHQMVHEQYLKEKDKCNLPPDFEARMDKILDESMKSMPWDRLIEQVMVPVYEKHFTKGDMDALVAFYSSPVGQKMWREMPKVMADSMKAMMPIMLKHNEEMSRRIHEEIQKDSAKKSCPGGSAQGHR